MKPSGWWLVSIYVTCFHPSFILAIKRIIVNYSSQNLSSVPPGLKPSTEDLDLSLNRIQALSGKDFLTTPQLHFLNLSWNILEKIDTDTFNSTPALEILDLSHNRLQNLSDQPYLLKTGRLQFLDLSSNLFSVMALGREFSTLKCLQWLGLSAKSISNQDFTYITNLTLKTLFINAHGLQTYKESSLTGVHAEKAIIALSKSNLDNAIAVDVFAAFKEVEFTMVDSGMKVIQQLHHRGIVRTVSLEFSKVETTWHVLTKCVNTILQSSIQQLSFSDLTMTEMEDGMPLVTSRLLDSFSTTRASVTEFIFNQKELYDFFINMPARNVSLTQTPIIFMTCPLTVNKIEVLDLSNCALTENVFSVDPDTECSTLTNLVKLVLRGNNLKHLGPLTSRIHLMDSLQYVDLSQNKLTYSEEQGKCAWPSKVVQLDLSSNGFDQSVFKCLPDSVRILKLRNNRVITVPADVRALDDLNVLDLMDNRLLDLPTCQAFPNLQKLSVRSNSLHSPLPRALETCPHLKDLDLSRNPFICTCALRKFAALIKDKATRPKGETPGLTLGHWPAGYRCSYPESRSNTLLEDFYLPEISCNPLILAITILIPTITLVIAISLICHRLDVPWYVKMIWKWTRAKHHAITSQRKAEDLEGLRFHAFVSYSQKNADWVKSQFLPKLEGDYCLRVCHHERDFIPGKTIVQNILRCIEQSRRCVFVLSSHFVQSEWCHYELYFANHQRVTRGMDSIILILLEPLPLYLIPSKYYQLKSMMSRRTYLEWPPEGAKQKLFWANLRAALQTDLPITSEREE
ncbi:toll-like receptor 1 [Labeo rohita]|uniref:Toll-like receptor 1 n=4 Tax=Labeo rohita TaxID=84645 RepID=A0A498MLK6_LABRO|nr:toll-like receptor 1 [Labeo rohita]KAI2656691.1 Toll-like receptor 6 [Labeo rohita]RXN17857.1 toll-like receptor 1 [Labeo rohita]